MSLHSLFVSRGLVTHVSPPARLLRRRFSVLLLKALSAASSNGVHPPYVVLAVNLPAVVYICCEFYCLHYAY